MKLKFKHQQFQKDAAQAITDVFFGQPFSDRNTYQIDQGTGGGNFFEMIGTSNMPLKIERETLIDNIRQVQMRQGMRPIDRLEGGKDLKLTIEMETGTGKTYTYIKTMYELNAKYGWSKFIIVVPSVAIREGVKKSFDILQDHFAQDYGKRIQYFIYDSSQPTKIDIFASDTNMHVMIINTQAFNARGEDARRIYMALDSFRSRKPIDVIAATNPIVIIDEPQSVLGANKANATREKMTEFNPLFTLLYSATHRKDDVYNMIYRLDAMDAYNKKLVKKIAVKGIEQKGSTATNGYFNLQEIVISTGNPQARISFDVKSDSGVKQTTKTVDEGFNLYDHSGELAEYKDGYIIQQIDGREGSVTLLNGQKFYEGDVVGAVNEDALRRIQISETIYTHLERERELYRKGIKVLSLFFIDHVENYRVYEEGGATSNGKFADMFEEEYNKAVETLQLNFDEGEYSRYLGKWRAEQVHQGYFSKDKKGRFVNSKLERGTTESNDRDAYDLIMKDKERLLSFDEPVRFIFSHSALKEGWDNPNVFQICTLKNSDNETKKRQEVGRGMRLCVNDRGERQDEDVLGMDVHETNVLTIIASESYDNFAKKLQTEIAEVVADRPVLVTATLFNDQVVYDQNGEVHRFSHEESVGIVEMLAYQGYVRKGRLTDKYHQDKKSKTLDFDEYNAVKDAIVLMLDKIYDPDKLMPDNSRKVREAHFDKNKFDKKEFQNLWKKINTKTYYTVDFETDELIKKAIKEIDDHLNVSEIRIMVGSGSLEKIQDKQSLQNQTAMTAAKVKTIHVKEAIGGSVTYDLIGKLVEATQLTRHTIVQILTGIKDATFKQFRINPEEFLIKVGNMINQVKALAVIQHIEYHKLDEHFETDIFAESTLKGKLGINAIESAKSLYDLVVVDSEGIEKRFAEELEAHDDVVVYTKLPRGFYINTPMGKYNPDWAIALKEGEVKHIYFVAETKGSLESGQLRGTEAAKIECARQHFQTISAGDIKYDVVTSYSELMDAVMN